MLATPATKAALTTPFELTVDHIHGLFIAITGLFIAITGLFIAESLP